LGDADGVRRAGGTRVVARTTTVSGVYRFWSRQGAYTTQSVVNDLVHDETLPADDR
jgi:hypothetical protein